MVKVSNKFVQKVIKIQQQKKSLKKFKNENALDKIFDLLIELEEKQNGQGYKFIQDFLLNHDRLNKKTSN